jgi:hypothetical protein
MIKEKATMNPTISKSQKEKLIGAIQTGEPCPFGGHDPSNPKNYGKMS